MFGRAALILVLGYSSIFLLYTANMLSTGVKTIDVYTSYYNQTMAENITTAGANIACNLIYTSPGWSAGFTNLPCFGGTVTVSVAYTSGNIIRIVAVGRFNGYEDSTFIRLQPSNYAKFGNFYAQATAIPATGDTLDGPIHINDYCGVFGDPVFKGKVSCLRGVKKYYNPSNPKFLGGYESGINLPLAYNSSGMATIAGSGGAVLQSANASKPLMDVDLTFNADGTVSYKTRIGTSTTSYDPWSTVTTIALSTFAPNGVINVNKGNVTVRGVVNGRATVVAQKNGYSGAGQVFFDQDLVYNTNPLTNPGSGDMLGIVAEEKATVKYNSSRSNISIQASLFVQNDGLNIENYSSYPGIGNLNLLGGLIAKDIKPTAAYSGSTPVKGYRFVHKYDTRFLTTIPPFFPTTGNYEVLSWFE